MIRVLMIDDHALVRAGFRMILDAAPDIDIVGEAASGDEGVRIARQLKPDVVLMDVQMPGMTGLEATQRLMLADQPPRILAVTASGDELLARRMLEAGASGYLIKACPQEELLLAVRQVADGRRYLCVEVARTLALRALEGGGDSPFDRLTPRELDISLRVAAGETMPDIAVHLNISAKTVATHKYRVFEKLEVANDVALSRLAQRSGLIDPMQ